MFTSQTLDADGNTIYEPYNRFPIGSYALTKLAILPFGDDLSVKLYVARTLMLLFFAAAVVLAYLSLRRLASGRWIALTATLLAFSSPYCLYYSDMISSETAIDLFGMLLVFHGMVIFEQEGRFRQLPIKACIALLLGWHVYALLLPFIVFGLTRELIKARPNFSTPFSLALCQLKRATLSLLRSRYMTLGVVTLIFGISLLTFNLTSEYLAQNREIPLTELHSFTSMMYRIGVDTSTRYNDWLSWRTFPERQFHRIGMMFLPYAFSPSFVDHDLREAILRVFVVLGIAVSGASLIGLLFVRRHTILLATLALSGFCWALPMRHNTADPSHNSEAVFYIGATLTLFSLVLLCLRRLSNERLIAALSVAALLIFALSALRMSQLDNSNKRVEEELQKTLIADLEVIRNMTGKGKVIETNTMPRFYAQSTIHAYYLSGRIGIHARKTVPSERTPDFVVTGVFANRLASLTPQNRIAFLYEWEDYHRHINEITKSGEPLIHSEYDVYLNYNTLLYVKNACRRNDTRAIFFLALYPISESDLSAERRQHGFDNLDFHFRHNAIRQSGDQCIAIVQLPDYDIARIQTGQYIQRADGSFEHIWEDDVRLTDTAH